MRSILLHIHDDRCLEAKTQVALDLARGFEGHITCLQAIPYEFGAPGYIYGSTASEIMAVVKEHADKQREQMEAKLTKEDVAWDWLQQDGWARYRIPTLATLHDIIVLGACDEADGRKSYSDLAADIVIRTHTPILLVPESCKSFDTTAPVVVAWNGSPEVGVALRCALPLLQQASEVLLVCVEEKPDDEGGEFPAEKGAQYLARHGIEPETVTEPMLKSGIAATLNHVAKSRNAGCIVMGAYGHSRFRELMLGGVSRDMMTDPELPLLMAH